MPSRAVRGSPRSWPRSVIAARRRRSGGERPDAPAGSRAAPLGVPPSRRPNRRRAPPPASVDVRGAKKPTANPGRPRRATGSSGSARKATAAASRPCGVPRFWPPCPAQQRAPAGPAAAAGTQRRRPRRRGQSTALRPAPRGLWRNRPAFRAATRSGGWMRRLNHAMPATGGRLPSTAAGTTAPSRRPPGSREQTAHARPRAWTPVAALSRRPGLATPNRPTVAPHQSRRPGSEQLGQGDAAGSPCVTRSWRFSLSIAWNSPAHASDVNASSAVDAAAAASLAVLPRLRGREAETPAVVAAQHRARATACTQRGWGPRRARGRRLVDERFGLVDAKCRESQGFGLAPLGRGGGCGCWSSSPDATSLPGGRRQLEERLDRGGRAPRPWSRRSAPRTHRRAVAVVVQEPAAPQDRALPPPRRPARPIARRRDRGGVRTAGREPRPRVPVRRGSHGGRHPAGVRRGETRQAHPAGALRA